MELLQISLDFYHWLKISIGELPGGQFIKQFLRLFVTFSSFFLIIFIIERCYGVKTLVYRTKNFFHDVTYWIYYFSGLGNKLLMGPVLYLIGDNFNVFKINLLGGLPILWQIFLALLIIDFLGYWVHRMQHAVPFFWAFHTTHHSQRGLNFASTARFHPIEQFTQNFILLVPALMLGADPKSAVIFYYLIEFNGALQHSNIPWRYGPLYYLVSSPRFHSFHHSMEPAHHNRNFGGFFSVFDFLFGTAVDEKAPPQHLGLPDIEPTSFLSTLYTPFVLLHRQFKAKRSLPQTENG